ncbi:MAG TPA: PilZ domain-containing protein [Aestuariivirgaceae bacterium]|nr:PilZ domain-containing protein [Aestuariivirgaceae bacterium]
MTSAIAETAETGNGREPRAILFGRFMLPDSSEHPCQVTQLTPEGAIFLTGIAARPGLGIVAYIDEIGRLEAMAGEAVEGGFAVTFQISGPRRERIASRIRVLRSLSPDDDEIETRHRRDPRHETGSASHLTLPDGRVYPCEVVDVSLSGAAVRTEVIPALGTCILLGKMRGRVVRYLDSGVAIEFTRQVEAPAASAPR